jgi:hypothetical protein
MELSDEDQMYSSDPLAIQLTKACFDEYPAVASACKTWDGESCSYAEERAPGGVRFAALIYEMSMHSMVRSTIAAEVPEEQSWCVD